MIMTFDKHLLISLFFIAQRREPLHFAFPSPAVNFVQVCWNVCVCVEIPKVPPLKYIW